MISQQTGCCPAFSAITALQPSSTWRILVTHLLCQAPGWAVMGTSPESGRPCPCPAGGGGTDRQICAGHGDEVLQKPQGEVSRNHSTSESHANSDASNIHSPELPHPPPTPRAQGIHMEGHCPGNDVMGHTASVDTLIPLVLVITRSPPSS